jgi:hypothetical protein
MHFVIESNRGAQFTLVEGIDSIVIAASDAILRISTTNFPYSIFCSSPVPRSLPCATCPCLGVLFTSSLSPVVRIFVILPTVEQFESEELPAVPMPKKFKGKKKDITIREALKEVDEMLKKFEEEEEEEGLDSEKEQNVRLSLLPPRGGGVDSVSSVLHHECSTHRHRRKHSSIQQPQPQAVIDEYENEPLQFEAEKPEHFVYFADLADSIPGVKDVLHRARDLRGYSNALVGRMESGREHGVEVRQGPQTRQVHTHSLSLSIFKSVSVLMFSCSSPMLYIPITFKNVKAGKYRLFIRYCSTSA